jgi:hypothetical protein
VARRPVSGLPLGFLANLLHELIRLACHTFRIACAVFGLLRQLQCPCFFVPRLLRRSIGLLHQRGD